MHGRFLKRIRYNLVWIQIRSLTAKNKKSDNQKERVALEAPPTIQII
jgi:hypothetical protein